jgi:hypothetical protein
LGRAIQIEALAETRACPHLGTSEARSVVLQERSVMRS